MVDSNVNVSTEADSANGPDNVAPVITAPAKPVTRDAARAQIFSAKSKSETIEFFGVQVDIREPTLEDVLSFQSGDDQKARMAEMITKYVYLSGSQDKLFEEADQDSILALPFGADVQRLQTAINKSMGVTPTTEDKSQAEV